MKDCFKIRKRLVEIEDWNAADKVHFLHPLLSKVSNVPFELVVFLVGYNTP